MKNVFNILNAKYKNVKLEDDFILIEPFAESDVTFFVHVDGGTGWYCYSHSDTFKSVGKDIPSKGTSDEALLKAIEKAIKMYKKEQQEFFDACTDALVNFNGWTREKAIESQIYDEHVFTKTWMKELDIK